jgi:hypothetical protein
MSRRKSAYGAPAEETELVVAVDRRLVLAGGVVGLLILAIAAGAAFGEIQRRAAGRTSSSVVQSGGQVPGVGEFSRSPVVVPTIGPVGGTPGSPLDLPPEFGSEATVDPALLRPRPTVPANRLATILDANLTEYPIARIGDPVSDGPRVAVSDLNDKNTFDFGTIKADSPARYEFRLQNIGRQDLIISRVYTGCGCTVARVGDVALAADGHLAQPLVLQAQQSVDVQITYDPRITGERGGQMKYIQIFSNDPNGPVFDDANPELTHEVRFRIVANVVP